MPPLDVRRLREHPAAVSRVMLPRLEPAREKLGLPTIMDRALAARHGAPYVHLAVFAIDVDRVREAAEGPDDPRPFGWDVLLVQAYLEGLYGEAACDPRVEAAVLDAAVLDAAVLEDTVLEDTVLSILDGAPDALGAQLVFAVWDSVERGVLPNSLRSAFRGWRGRPKALAKQLAKLRSEGDARVAACARDCLEIALDPPLAPPTRQELERLAGGRGV
jgi:hypothetical protein